MASVDMSHVEQSQTMGEEEEDDDDEGGGFEMQFECFDLQWKYRSQESHAIISSLS